MHADRPNDVTSLVNDRVAAIEAGLIEIRRDLHAHPELGMDTVRTAGVVAAELTRLGLTPQMGVGGHGVVAEIAGARPGPCLLIRADMDALPIEELTGLDFASTVPGRMHACGHDIHTATLLGVGTVLKDLAPMLRGTVRLVFQPAEETVESGAAAMVAAGAAAGADIALAFHNRPELAVGRFAYTRGAATASSDEFDVVIHGKSGHAARPHAAVDPIVATAAMITQLQTAVSRVMDPSHSSVLTIGHIEGGSTHNIIPDSCMFQGTVRCRSAESRDTMEATFRRIVEGIAAAMGVTADISYQRGAPALVNDDRVVDATIAAVGAQFGDDQLEQLEGRFGAEDFSYFSDLIPSCQLLVGASQPGRQDRVHNSHYQPDERCIGLGTAALVRAALDILA
ncbi:amidohydrolase [Acidisoma cellulosilytica]|uniref:Amidohydrolase n=1 Tax=Acidisoma cellulosilyticum TaxID=2802395 RepID=A0A963Z3W9_9PROT|nr:M20 family metallopeptidase [Acidisoma cellulosilyticum]MCB8882144.1 amidohydrolase [Acidisoma cellulosilyticum]